MGRTPENVNAHELYQELFRDKFNIEGLYTIVTGKMSLVFHASKSAVEKILDKDMELIVKSKMKAFIPGKMLAVEPWSSPERI